MRCPTPWWKPHVTAVVDLHRTSFLDSHGVTSLLAGYQATVQAGRHFTALHAHGLVKRRPRHHRPSEVLLDRDHPAAPSDPAT
jgi:hypothetical protein